MASVKMNSKQVAIIGCAFILLQLAGLAFGNLCYRCREVSEAYYQSGDEERPPCSKPKEVRCDGDKEHCGNFTGTVTYEGHTYNLKDADCYTFPGQYFALANLTPTNKKDGECMDIDHEQGGVHVEGRGCVCYEDRCNLQPNPKAALRFPLYLLKTLVKH